MQPISIRVTGEYEEFARFIEATAALPRIVTQHDISIRPGGGALTMDMVARTYRYLDEEELAEIAAAQQQKAKGKGRRRR